MAESNVTQLTARGVARWAAQMLVALLIAAVVLFLAAGRLDWPAGWAYLALNALTQALSALVLIPRRPDMLAERSAVRAGTPGWDRWLAPAVVLGGSLALIVTAGLDARFGWSGPLRGELWVVALCVAFACQMFVLWAMASNPFFATTVRIQADRGHAVARGGPYALVRHPGYLGSLVYTLVSPLVLMSWWAYIPALVTVALLVVRTALEDRTLQAELAGYRDYAAAVRWRLLPGLW